MADRAFWMNDVEVVVDRVVDDYGVELMILRPLQVVVDDYGTRWTSYPKATRPGPQGGDVRNGNLD